MTEAIVINTPGVQTLIMIAFVIVAIVLRLVWPT